ncbi:MAG: hypothetical protein HPY90_10135 [Syntrophothermus sp.]|uniref:hypothetical protein n=1 Tax=Syntrophothermus sp. TaxID=2736299 RepID=UPI00257B8D6F|nr:hypothetical protein [Syntrophothermus sp.]NSW83610.1 hypothetical protein [Syntrophothermus sp.]
MKRIVSLLIVSLLIFAFCLPVLAEDAGSDSSPFGPGYAKQGYVPLQFVFPTDNKHGEYAAACVWGTNPKDGKLAVYQETVQSRQQGELLEKFLQANSDVIPYSNNQYNLWKAWNEVQAPFLRVEYIQGKTKAGETERKQLPENEIRLLPSSQIEADRAAGIKLYYPDDPGLAPGGYGTYEFLPPDFQVKTVSNGVTAELKAGQEYTASAEFYLNYPMGTENVLVELFHRANGQMERIASQVVNFGPFQSITLQGQYKAAASQDEQIVAVVHRADWFNQTEYNRYSLPGPETEDFDLIDKDGIKLVPPGGKWVEENFANNIMSSQVKPAPVNLTVVSIETSVDGRQANPNERYNVSVYFKNDSTVPLDNVPVALFNDQWRAKLWDSSGQEVQYITHMEPGQTVQLDSTVSAPPEGSRTLTAYIDIAPIEDKYAETDNSDNILQKTVEVRPLATDARVVSIKPANPYPYAGDDSYIIADFARDDQGPETVTVQLEISGPGASKQKTTTLGRNGTCRLIAPVKFTKAGSFTYTASIWVLDGQDSDPSNNQKSVMVKVKTLAQPPTVESGTEVEIIS